MVRCSSRLPRGPIRQFGFFFGIEVIEFALGDEVAEHGVIIAADRLGLQHALGNLLSNAGRFAKTKVLIHTAVADGMTTIDVDDDGCGIAQADRQRVFEPFVRLVITATAAGMGRA